ncbi:uncharacterized protein LOC123561503 [Mercenaria mercenaria]|uniref:uncharacterized protein LOC123561503 n=1 Tax=Mercenaria mercenaria TaxID=6596 RepID=UPI001E1DB8AE|nr:uncharacterized protein LOC123561503 [Mercenaria mercenaria]XP_053409107.1 uncharacterized protein LOC123561503 [Mercenaria mercenaria]
MNAKGKISSFSLLYGMFVMIVLNPATVSTTPPLCQSRCEEAVPNLRRLKQLWHTLSKREGTDDISFTHFIRSLIYAAGRRGSRFPLKKDLINMVLEYKDCMKACEHQHSKRSGHTNIYRRYYSLCFPPHQCLFRQ